MARTKISAQRHAGTGGKSPKKSEKSVKGLKSVKTVREKAEKKLKDKIDGKDVTQNPETGEAVKVKRTHRWRPGTQALREIRRLQKSTDTLVPHAPFLRLVREVLGERSPSGMRITANCAQLLHQISEEFIHDVMQATQVTAVANGRVQPKAHDFRLALALHPIWKDYVPKELNRTSATESELKKQFAIREYLRSFKAQSPEEAKLAKEKADLLRHNRDLLRQEHRVKDIAKPTKRVKIAAEEKKTTTTDATEAMEEVSTAATASAATSEDEEKKASTAQTTTTEAAAETNGHHHAHENGVNGVTASEPKKPKKQRTKQTPSHKVADSTTAAAAAAATVDSVEF
jgi:histone H3/H4